jgi:hypothetical protein
MLIIAFIHQNKINDKPPLAILHLLACKRENMKEEKLSDEKVSLIQQGKQNSLFN